jgi:hypothetical protein
MDRAELRRAAMLPAIVPANTSIGSNISDGCCGCTSTFKYIWIQIAIFAIADCPESPAVPLHLDSQCAFVLCSYDWPGVNI